MEKHVKENEAGSNLEEIVTKLKKALGTEMSLLTQVGRGPAREAICTIRESIKFLADVAEQIDIWDSLEPAKESLRDFSRVGLSASLYLLKEYYWSDKTGWDEGCHRDEHLCI